MRTKLINYIKAAFPAVAVQTTEEQRAMADVIEAAKQVKKAVVTWSAMEGARQIFPAVKTFDDTEDLLAASRQRFEDTVYIMRDVHTWPFDRDPVLARAFRDLVAAAPAAGSCIVLIAPEYKPHPTVERLITVTDYSLPSKDDLAKIGAGIAESAGKKDLAVGDDVLRALGGLSTTEAENALALALVETGTFDPAVIYREKVQAVKRSGLLDIVDADPRGLDSVGGLDELKEWIVKRRRAYSPEAEKFGLPSPKGVLLVGVPGCMAGDTGLFYLRGGRPSGREISLHDFYLKFNGLPASTRPWVDRTVPTFLHSLGPDGEVFYNRVISVIEAGIKPLLRLEFDDGSHLRLTADHPVATPGGKFIPAGELGIGRAVLARGSMKPTSQGGRDLKARPPRIVVNVKFHEFGSRRVIEENGNVYEYRRLARARLVVEAHMNDLAYDEYVHCLKHNAEAAARLKFLPPEMEVHHIDEDTLNDSLDNLMVLHKVDHAREHGKGENFNVEYVREVRVTAVRSDGDEMTYDIQMDMPANNFVANGIIVHNTGKSLSAKAFGTALGVPTIRLDIGALFNSLVGESEARCRDALKLAEAMSPCVLWVDEIDKGLAGASGSGSGDSGVTRRVFGSIINWMQERRRPVFLVATANQVEGLPPELLRKGRFDEIFAIDLPDANDRAAIFSIHIGKRGRDVKNFKLVALAAATVDFTGSEIETVIDEAMFNAFDLGRDIETDDLVAAAGAMVPLAKTAKEQIDAIRQWAKTRARFASRQVAAEQPQAGKRKLASAKE